MKKNKLKEFDVIYPGYLENKQLLDVLDGKAITICPKPPKNHWWNWDCGQFGIYFILRKIEGFKKNTKNKEYNHYK